MIRSWTLQLHPLIPVSVRQSEQAPQHEFCVSSFLVWKTPKSYWWGCTKPTPWFPQFIPSKKKNKKKEKACNMETTVMSSVSRWIYFCNQKVRKQGRQHKKGSILRRWDNTFNNLIENQCFCHYRTRAFQLIYCELIWLLILWYHVNPFHAFAVIVLSKLEVLQKLCLSLNQCFCILREYRG